MAIINTLLLLVFNLRQYLLYQMTIAETIDRLIGLMSEIAILIFDN